MVQNIDLTPGTCPQCSGRTVQNVVSRNAAGQPVLVAVTCGVCGGTGILPQDRTIGLPPPPAPAAAPAASDFPLWPFLIPLGLFVLFFLYLWL